MESENPSVVAGSAYRVVIVDDHQAVRELLISKLTNPDLPNRYQVVGQGSSGQEAVELCQGLKPDLLVLDLMLPDFNGVEVWTRLKRVLPSLHVIFFTGCEQASLVDQALAQGASGYVLKKRPLQTLLGAIREVCGGRRYFDPDLLTLRRRPGREFAGQPLTPREKEVAQLIALGRSTKEAADVLGLSVKTVDKHRTNLMSKLGVHDAVSVTHYAIAMGLISLS